MDKIKFREVDLGEKGYTRSGSPRFYKLLEEMADTHDKKSYDYASNDKPYANYEFAGWLAHLFKHSELDLGFVSRIGEKLYRLANLGGGSKIPKNESIEDTERDLCVIMTLWMAARRDKRFLPGQMSDYEADSMSHQEETAAPEQADMKVLSVLLTLEPLMNRTTLARAINYLQGCQSTSPSQSCSQTQERVGDTSQLNQ